MNIAVDAMGGDHAPHATVDGALLAETETHATLILVGDEAQLTQNLGPAALTTTIKIVHAPEVVDMGEAGPVALRRNRKSSLSVAFRLLADGKVDGLVSAGNSSAIVVMAKHFVGLIPGLRRPAFPVPIPTPDGRVLLIDAGAHHQATSVHLAQCAILADAYLKVTEKLPHPRLGLLNIGSEPSKGPPLIQAVYALLERIPLHFVGNIEPHEIFSDRVDAIICDGFVGNLLIKIIEGIVELYFRYRKDDTVLQQQLPEAESGVTWTQLAHCYRYQEVGGVPLLGTRKPVVVAHGRSDSRAIANAILQTVNMISNDVCNKMIRIEERNGLLSEIKRHYTAWMLGRWKDKWRLRSGANQ